MRRLAQVWRRSIMFRVVASSVVLSSLVVAFAGFALLRTVADGLTEHRQAVVVSQAKTGFDSAQAGLDAEVSADDSGQSLVQLVDTLAATSPETRPYELVLIGPLDSGGNDPVRESGSVAASDLPPELVAAVRSSDDLYWQYTDVLTDSKGHKVPAIVVGKRLSASNYDQEYELFYIYSLSDEVATLNLVRQAVFVGDLAVVVLLGVIAWFVTRRAINPMRLVRRTAERLSAGHLEQRMHVHGEDDITRLSVSFNKMAESLQLQIRQLEDLSALQQRFVSDVSHELRTPLTTVRMASDVLHEFRDDLDPQLARSAELLNAEIGRFSSLLEDLLDLSRFDAGAADLAVERVNLADTARVAAQSSVLMRAGMKVTVKGTAQPELVEADPRRVERIVRNLVNNAAAYSGSDTLEFVVAENDDVVSLGVRDHGVGMTAEQTRRVFDRFWRADPARPQGGTGLGMAIAMEDAKLHNGLLSVWSEPGMGTEFILSLPKPGCRAEAHALRSVYS